MRKLSAHLVSLYYDTLSSETLNPLVSTSGDIIFELPNEVVNSSTSPTLVFSARDETFECELK